MDGLTPPERALLDSATLADAWPLVEAFATLRREAPEDCNRAAAMIADRLRAHGVPVTMHEPQLFLSIPKGAHVQAGDRRCFARPAPLAKPAPDGVTAPLVFVAEPKSPPDGWAPHTQPYFGPGFDPAAGLPAMAGCIVLYRGMISCERILGFQRLGAVGAIAINPGDAAHWGSGSPVWGSPDTDDLPWKPSIPAAAVGKPDGDALVDLAEAGGQATLVTAMDEGWFDCRLPVVDIPGTEDPGKFVLLHGHYDAWDVGVGDNATGDACMMEVARALWQHRAQLKRGVRIAWWPGHSTGRFAGSTWYADHAAREIADGCVLHMNCDSPGCRDATEYNAIPLMAENYGFVKSVVADATGKTAKGKRPTQSSDFSFNNLGVSGCFSASSRIAPEEIARRGWYFVMGNGGNIAWHTDNDQLEVADPEVLLRDIRLYLLAAWRAANAEILPFDFAPLLDEFATTLAGYAKSAGDHFDLSPAADAIADLRAALAHLPALPPAARNAALLGLSRHLVPLNYVRGERWRRDIGLPAPPLPLLAIAAELHRYPGAAANFALTTLRRGQNRFLAEMAAARAAIPS
ncbi:M28 family peptidase [Humitalea sp. 24SJ18S-53]|uniref:M28 family peptidase n=1 Tax=Humitalea sp. 24SJ18S-53 TaxID=3422307 RepID=UPI003D66A462